MSKYALIINGDREPRHLQNVERSLADVLKPEGYETFVASPEAPQTKPDHYAASTPENIKQLVLELKSKIGEGDELVIYTTGHGGQNGDAGSLCLQESCDDFQSMHALLDGIPYGGGRSLWISVIPETGTRFLRTIRRLFLFLPAAKMKRSVAGK